MSRLIPWYVAVGPIFGGLIFEPHRTIAADEPADPLLARMDRAMDTYKEEMGIYRRKAQFWLDEQEKSARKKGDLGAVKRIAEEMRVFRVTSDLPGHAPQELRARPGNAKSLLLKAYTSSMKEYVRTKQDAKAAALEGTIAALSGWLDPSLSRRVWIHEKDGSFHMVGKGQWEEHIPNGGARMKWTEHDRTKDYVELWADLDGQRHFMRLSDKTDNRRIEPNQDWKPFFGPGKWRE